MNVKMLMALGDTASELAAQPRHFLDILRRLLESLCAEVHADAAELYLADPQQQLLLLTAFAGADQQIFAERQHFPFGEGFPGLAAQQRCSQETSHLEADARFLRPEVLAAGYHTFVSVPLLLPHGVIGVLCMACRTADQSTGLRRDLEQLAPLLAACLHSCLESLGGRLRTEIGQLPDLSAATHELLGEMVNFSLALSAVVRPLHTGSEGNAAPPAETCLGLRQCPSLQGRLSLSGNTALTCPQQGQATLCLPVYQGGEVTAVSTLHFSRQEAASGHAAAPLLWLTRQALEAMPPLSVRPTHDATPTEKPPAEMLPWLDIAMLGRFQVRRAGETLEPRAFKRRQAYLLLKILASRFGRAVATDELCSALWPGEAPDKTVPRLHVTLNALRQVIEPDPQQQQVIVRDGQTYAFAPGVPYRLDVEEFERLVQSGDLTSGAQALEHYAAALSLYRGDLLEDEPYGVWTALERDYYHELAVRSLLRMADLQAGLGLRAEQLLTYTKLLSLDPYQFSAYEDLIACLSAEGRLAEASTWQQRFSQALTGEPLLDWPAGNRA